MEEVSTTPVVSSNKFFEKVKANWKKIAIYTIVILLVIFLLYPRAYSYELEDTCESRIGIVNARCIGFRTEMLDIHEKTIGGELCSITREGKRCTGITIFEKLN